VTVPTVAHHGRETAYEITPGDGPTLCCVHGSGGEKGVWKAQRARLEFPVAAVDLTGHGDSDDRSLRAGDETRTVYVEDTLAVASAVDAEILIGNSLGGSVVLEAVLDHEPGVEAAILVGSGAKLGVMESLRTWLATDWERAIEFLHGPDRLFHDPDERLRRQSIATMRAVGQRVTERDYLTCHEFDVRERLAEIHQPLLAFTGEFDQLTPPRFHRYISRECSGGQAALVPNAAHLSMLEAPAAVNNLITEFVTAQCG
jgi:3-oxoadipate enol-lactonase